MAATVAEKPRPLGSSELEKLMTTLVRRSRWSADRERPMSYYAGIIASDLCRGSGDSPTPTGARAWRGCQSEVIFRLPLPEGASRKPPPRFCHSSRSIAGR